MQSDAVMTLYFRNTFMRDTERCSVLCWLLPDRWCFCRPVFLCST